MATCATCAAKLPADARFCPKCGAAVDTAPAASVEERKLATVLFADLVGSTAAADAQDPERTRARLDRFYDAMAAEIDAAGGTLEKFAGDAVMAAFGVPVAQEDHAERALHAALAMQRRLGTLFGAELALRIGVNSGEVVVGKPREGSSFVSGDAVNCAARLEQASGGGEVLVGERTAALVRGAFEFGEERNVEAKGKGDGLVALPLRRALSLMRPRGVSGLHRAFVGRDAELDLLLATYARATGQGDPHVVTIMADAGTGKTRLVRELWERLGAEQPEPLRRTGRCLAYGEGITYWPLGEILKEHLAILDSDAPDVVRERLRGREILGLALGLDVAADLHPLAARDRLHDAWVEFVEQLASERPVVLLLEDLHWAEPPLLDLVERLAREVRGPLLVLATARPELLDARPSWGGGTRNASLLWLEPLQVADTAAMAEALVGVPLPPVLRDMIVERAEGNPFVVEELLATLLDRGVLARDTGGWRFSELPQGFAIPDSVHALVAARMDLLPAAEKTALQAAAVAGRAFWAGPLVELLDRAEPDFALLEGRDFIRRRSPSSLEGEREFVFKHALTRDVAYASVPKARRARLHARFAEWLERFGHGRDELAALLAHHFAEAVKDEDADLAWAEAREEEAALRSKAALWLRRSGALAVGRYELDEGVAQLERAVELETRPEVQADIWREIGRAYALKFDAQPFTDAMQRSLELSTDRRQRADTLAELAYQTATRAGMWRRAPDPEEVAAWIDGAVELTDEGSVGRARALLARVWWRNDADVAAATEAYEIAEAIGTPELRMDARSALALAAGLEGHVDVALSWIAQSLALLDQIRDPEKKAEIFETPIPVNVMAGRFEEARRMAASFGEATVRLTAHHRVHGVAMRAELEEVTGEWERIRVATPAIERAIADNLDTPCVRNQRTLLVAAAAAAYVGDEREARRLEEKGEGLAMEGYDRAFYASRLRLALARGDLERVAALVDAELAESHTRRLFWFALPGIAAHLDALLALGEHERAVSEAEQAMSGGPYVAAFARRTLGVARGQPALIDDALSRFEQMGLAWHAEMTRRMRAA
jgi:class 3 adenylate cyclase